VFLFTQHDFDGIVTTSRKMLIIAKMEEISLKTVLPFRTIIISLK